MFSVPLICSSSGVATVCAITLGLAPGNTAFTTTDGGTTSGYSEIGSCVIAISPARKIRIEITPAKIGRSTKNFDRFIGRLSDAFRRFCGHDVSWFHRDTLALARGQLANCRKPGKMRCNHCARRDALHAVHDNFITGMQTGKYNPLAIDLLAERHFPERYLVIAR